MSQTNIVGGFVLDYETADISSSDHVFNKTPHSIYVDADAVVVMTINGKTDTWNLTKGNNPYRPSQIVQAGTDTGVVIRGCY